MCSCHCPHCLPRDAIHCYNAGNGCNGSAPVKKLGTTEGRTQLNRGTVGGRGGGILLESIIPEQREGCQDETWRPV